MQFTESDIEFINAVVAGHQQLADAAEAYLSATNDMSNPEAVALARNTYEASAHQKTCANLLILAPTTRHGDVEVDASY